MSIRGFLMMDLLRAFYWIDEALQSGLQARGWSNVSRSQSLILVNIAFGVRRASVLAGNLGVSRQAISQMLAELQRADLIEFRPDPEDGRAQLIAFSPKSMGLRDDAMAILERIEAEMLRTIGKRRMTALREALSADWGAPPVIEDSQTT